MKKERKIKIQLAINYLVKVFLFPLFIVGIILRYYDKLFKKESTRKRKTYNFWY